LPPERVVRVRALALMGGVKVTSQPARDAIDHHNRAVVS
jgi:hypothetical protein